MNDIKKKKLKESSGATNAQIDDGPPTFYKTFADYKKTSKEMFEEIDWEVLDYILSKGAEDPELDFTLSYNIVPVVAYGKAGDGEGYSNPIAKYKERINFILGNLDWEVIKWMGIKGKETTGVDVETPEQFLRDKSLEKSKNISHMIELQEDVSPDVIKSFKMQETLNPKIWDNEKLKPEIRKKLLIIAKNFFKDLELKPNVKLHDITLTGSISNYNWSKFSDIDLHLRLKFDEIDKDVNFVKNYVLSKKTIWNNKYEINIFGFPVEVYVENIGETHTASGLFSVLKNKWLIVPKKKKLQLDLDDIRSKVNGYLDLMPELKKLSKDNKYDEVITKIEKIQDKLKRMRISGLEQGGEFSIENIAFKALRRSTFITDIIQLKKVAYDKKMSMKDSIILPNKGIEEKIDITNEIKKLVEEL